MIGSSCGFYPARLDGLSKAIELDPKLAEAYFDRVRRLPIGVAEPGRRGIAFRVPRSMACRRLQSFGGYGVTKDATLGAHDIFNPLIAR
jgi:hypothetical protein